MKQASHLLFSVVFLSLLFPSVVNAATVQITNNAYNDYYTDFSEGKIAFFADDDNSGEYDIFLYDSVLSNTTRITNNNYRKTYPYISEGKVVWGSYDGSDYEIFLYEIITGTTTQITNNSVDDYSSQIDNGKIVLVHDETVNDSELFLYDIAAGTTAQITNNNYNDLNPQIDDGKVIWQSLGEIYLYDIASGNTIQITDNDYGEDSPKLNEGKVIWYHGNEIFLYNIATETTIQIANNNNGDFDYPKMSDGKVVWMGWSDDSSYEEIFLYDITTETTTQITNNDYFDGVPQIKDGKVAWMGYGYFDNTSEIFLYDIATATTTQLTNNSYEDVAPLTSDGKVVWGRFDGNDKEIFLWDQAIPDNTSPVISPIQDTTINLGTSYTETGSFTDTDSASWTATVDYGDGSGVQQLALNGASFQLNHLYTTANNFTITVTVTDDGELFDVETAEVTVINPEPVVLAPTADSYIKQGSSNENEGASTFVRLQSAGNNRALIKFDQSQIESAVNGAQNYTAKLQFTITDNGNNWGSTGRFIALHRLLQNWTEGNGFNDGNNPSFRGTGNGTTWNCGTDSNIQNQSANCTGADDWNMTSSSLWPFATAATATTIITNNQSGVVEFDVTADVQSFVSGANQNYGWLLKKTNEGQNGHIEFGSKESSNDPQLIVTHN